MRITATLAAALAIAALVAPAAPAQPADMLASTAQAAARAQQKQDLRSPDARDTALPVRDGGKAAPQPLPGPADLAHASAGARARPVGRDGRRIRHRLGGDRDRGRREPSPSLVRPPTTGQGRRPRTE